MNTTLIKWIQKPKLIGWALFSLMDVCSGMKEPEIMRYKWACKAET
jgi:hypothetical protein